MATFEDEFPRTAKWLAEKHAADAAAPRVRRPQKSENGDLKVVANAILQLHRGEDLSDVTIESLVNIIRRA